MLNPARASLALSGLLLAATAVTATGCGSSSSTPASELAGLCDQSCNKVVQCIGDAGAFADQILANCKASCTSPDGGTQTCTNAAALVPAAKACLAMSDCAAFEACAQSLPACQTGTSGTGGSSGGGQGGSSGGGQGGSSGGADAGAASCSSCDKAGTCCTALAALGGQSAAQCAAYSTASCNALATAQQSQFASNCVAVLNAGAAVSASCR